MLSGVLRFSCRTAKVDRKIGLSTDTDKLGFCTLLKYRIYISKVLLNIIIKY